MKQPNNTALQKRAAFSQVRKRVVILSHLILKEVILPRQARDKHTTGRENSKSERRFLCSTLDRTTRSTAECPTPAASSHILQMSRRRVVRRV